MAVQVTLCLLQGSLAAFVAFTGKIEHQRDRPVVRVTLRGGVHTSKIRRMEDIEYGPQPSLGIPTLVKAWFALGATAILLLLGIGARPAAYVAGFPALAAIAWFAAYAGKRRLRARLTAAGIERRRLRTRFFPWAEIRDVKVVNRVPVAHLAVMGSRNGARYGSRSGGGARKLVVGAGTAGQWPLTGTGHAGGLGERARPGIH
jgi:hypothetical protein